MARAGTTPCQLFRLNRPVNSLDGFMRRLFAQNLHFPDVNAFKRLLDSNRL